MPHPGQPHLSRERLESAPGVGNIDLRPAQDLQQEEKDAAANLAAAEREDDERKAAVAAGTRQAPGKGERPSLKAARGRAHVHAANAVALGALVQDALARAERSKKAARELERFDAEQADPMELRFWNLWQSVVDPDAAGRLLFYPTGSRRDYGNPSYKRNRGWWDRAALVYADPQVTLPEPIVAFRAEMTEVAQGYGRRVDESRDADSALLDAWKELVTLGRAVRKDRRSTRSYLADDFDHQSRWVDHLVAPPSEQGPRATAPPAPGGSNSVG